MRQNLMDLCEIQYGFAFDSARFTEVFQVNTQSNMLFMLEIC